VVAISDYVAEQLSRHYGFPASRVRKVFNGVDPDRTGQEQRQIDRVRVRERHRVGEDAALAVLVAHNFKLKGVRHWIEAMIRMKQADRSRLCSLIIGKDSPVRWKKWVSRVGLADSVRFVGSTDEVLAYYHAADFLVHPTYYDPCSRVVLESLASGLPCITTRFDGAAEVITDGENGFVLDCPDDVDAILDRTLRLMQPDVRRRFREQGTRLTDAISMRRHAEEMVQVYESVAREKDRS
jgi:UDP-glucose:(heptosyl)LPS alpha-1,3-glucosyltransferase